MKKVLLYILPLLCIFLSCSKSTGKTEIEFWTLQLSPTFDNYFKEIISKYEAEHPNIKIKWVDIPYDAVIQKLMSSVAAGNPPDLVNLSADFLSKFSGMKALADYKELLPDSLLNLYLPNAIEQCTYNNKITALPWYLNTYVLFYNTELLRQAGFTEKDVPKSFSQLIKFIRLYKDRTGKYAFFWNIGKDSYLPMMLGSEGIEMLNQSLSKASFNSTEAVNTIDEWIKLYKEGYLPKECIIKPGSTVIESYQAGQTALVFTGPVFLKRIQENAPAVYKSTEIKPAVTGKTGRHELAVMCISLLNSSTHKNEAAEFAYYVTNAQNQLKFCKLATIYPSVVEALKNPYFTNDD
ncbi:MAG: sugar ABC transporter substrate-binding protein, partial [Bacteroidota bacterium]|nr:sugar ABC transporter substrate-binding protein [Bacteroidota bacterium]